MSLAGACALGALQGLTEFLPVSSSGHLTIAERALGMEEPAEMLTLDAALHAATLAAALVYFGASWARALVRRPGLVAFVVLASVPPAAFYLAAGGVLEMAKGSLVALGLAFVASGAILVVVSRRAAASERGGDPSPGREARPIDGLWAGAAQAVALLPGVSRSGMSMSALLAVGLRREEVFELSFLAGAPLMCGALLVKAREIGELASASGADLGAGALAAFCAGLAALATLRRLVARGALWVFGAYAAAVGLACIAWGAASWIGGTQ